MDADDVLSEYVYYLLRIVKVVVFYVLYMYVYSFKSQWVYKFGLKLCVSYTAPSWHMGNIKGIDYTMSPYGYICAYYWGGLAKAHIYI